MIYTESVEAQGLRIAGNLQKAELPKSSEANARCPLPGKQSGTINTHEKQ